MESTAQSAEDPYAPPKALVLDSEDKDAVEQEGEATGLVLSGIGGFLLLPAIGIGLAPFFYFLRFVLIADAALNWPPLLRAPLLLLTFYEGIGNLSFTCFSAWLLVLMIRKSRQFPRLMIVLYVAVILYPVGDYFVRSSIPGLLPKDNFFPFVFALLGGMIWIPYFLDSVRVRNTFVN